VQTRGPANNEIMNGEARNVTVGAVVQSAEAAGFSLDVVAGEAGLERLITIPYPQKTGLALAGFDASLQPGRMLVFGESELRYLYALDAADDREADQPARRSPRAAREFSWRAARHPRTRRTDHGRERHRQE
jgi:hypothetical protein